jgi:hypothetical protein
VRAAYEFNLEFAAKYATDVSIAEGEEPAAASSAAGGASVDFAGGEDEDGAFVDDEWQPLPGGPFYARLMSKCRQPVSTATYRNYGVTIPFDPHDTLLSPSGQIRFPVVPGAEDGVTLQLPNSWSGETSCLVLKLKLDKTGATDRTVTINSALCRGPLVESEDEEDEDGMDLDEMGGEVEAEAPTPATPVDDLLAHEPPLHPSPLPAAAILTDGQIGERLAALHCEWEDEEQTTLVGTAETNVDDLHQLLDEMHVSRCDLLKPDMQYEFRRSSHGERNLVITSSPRSAQQVVPPPTLMEPSAAPRSSTRERKRKQRYGDAGELDGAASSFRSAPSARKKSVSFEDETSVPDFAFPPNELWAKGWHAGRHAWFRARVIKLRPKFPRIHVEFIADEGGNTNALALPELSAYVHAADVRPRDW